MGRCHSVFLDMSANAENLRMAYIRGNELEGLKGGYYVWLGDMLIGERFPLPPAPAATASPFNTTAAEPLFCTTWPWTARVPMPQPLPERLTRKSLLFLPAPSPRVEHRKAILSGKRRDSPKPLIIWPAPVPLMPAPRRIPPQGEREFRKRLHYLRKRHSYLCEQRQLHGRRLADHLQGEDRPPPGTELTELPARSTGTSSSVSRMPPQAEAQSSVP